MVHFFSGPGRCAAVAGLAIHSGTIEQLRLRYVVSRFGHGATVIALGDIGAAVA